MSQKRYHVDLNARITLKSHMRKSAARPDVVHVLSDGKKWAVKREGTSKAFKVFSHRTDAINRASTVRDARNVVVHNKNGTISRWNTPSRVRKSKSLW